MNEDTFEVPTLHATVLRHARNRPKASAVRCEDRVITYADLDARTRKIATQLLRFGLVAGDRVVFIGRNSDAIPLLSVAANRIGVVPVPLNWRLAPAEMVALVRDAEARLVFVDKEFASIADRIQSLQSSPVHVMAAAALRDGSSWPESVASGTQLFRDLAVADAIALQVYTSGTTGQPKGVMLSHRSLNGINTLRHLVEWDSWSETDVTLVSAPLGHIGAYGMMARTFFFGGEVVIQPAFDAGETLAAIERFGVSKIALVPTAIKIILEHPRARDTDYSRIDTIIYGASPIAPTLLRDAMAVFGCNFAQSYGMSETSGPVVALAPCDHDVNGAPWMAAAGQPLPGTEVRIVDPTGTPLAPWQDGEISIRSIANMVGYWNRPEESARTLSRDNWLLTGDAGCIDENGYVYVRSRVKEMIISGAENIYPAEVENAIASHPDVGEVAVIGVPDKHWGEAVRAIVAARPGRQIDPVAIQDWARARIAGYKVPKSVGIVTELPLNATGKVDKLALRALYSTATG